MKPTLAVKGMASKNQTQSQVPTVGIVSPILASKSEEKPKEVGGSQSQKKSKASESPEIDSPTIRVDDDIIIPMKPLKMSELPGIRNPTG